jgi:hypothetical protein
MVKLFFALGVVLLLCSCSTVEDKYQREIAIRDERVIDLDNDPARSTRQKAKEADPIHGYFYIGIPEAWASIQKIAEFFQ